MQTNGKKWTTEVDPLATTESLVLVVIASAVVWKIGTSAAFLGWAILSPLLLLRSPKADQLSNRLFNSMMPMSRANGGVWTIIIYSRLVIASVIARSLATIRFLPHGLLRLPENWSRVVFRSSVFDVPRFTPDGDSVTHRLKLFTVASKRGFVSSIANQIWIMTAVAVYAGLLIVTDTGTYPTWLFVLIRLTFFAFLLFAIGQSIGLMCQLLAMSYRVSVKASALFWLPLLFAVRGGFGSKKEIRDTLLDRQVAPLSRMGHWLAALGVAAGCLKFIAVPTLVGNTPEEFHGFLPQFLTNAPEVWEFVFFVSSVLTVAVSVFLVTPGPRRLDQKVWSETYVKSLYNGTTLALGFLATYTSLAAIDVFAPILPRIEFVADIVFQWWPS